MRNAILTLFIICALPLGAGAQRLCVEQVSGDKLLATGNYLDVFHLEAPAHTKAPRGFKPVYLSTYTRHGARLFSRETMYGNAYLLLTRAAADSMLTPTGEEFLRRYEEFYPLVKGRSYDLTTIGQEQHRRHAHRLVKEYRRLFRGRVHIDARSTQTPRTILSMTACTEELKGINPKLTITTSASPIDMGVLNPTSSYNPRALERDWDASLELPDAPYQEEYRRMWEEKGDPEEFFGRLFKDWRYVETVYPDGYTAQKMFYYVLADSQCATGGEGPFMEFATPEEMFAMWECENYRMCNIAGLTECFGGRPWALSEVLLRDVLAYAESDMAGRSVAGPYPDPARVRMRFGHDFKISTLMTLMDVEGWNRTARTSDEVKEIFNFSDLPMAASIEWAFYRNRKGEVLVKVVLNDREIKLPIDSYCGPYYRLEDFRAHCKARLTEADRILDSTL